MDIATVKKDLENQIGSINEDLKNIYIPLETALILLGKRAAFGIAIELIDSLQQEQQPAEWSEDWREEDIRTRFAFYTYKNEEDDCVLYLSNVFVEEASRNHGFGTKILAAAEKVAETIGAITIRLKVKQNSPANTWYRKHGYGYMAFEGDYDWLEKTLEYMKPVKQEWSEEDEAKVTFLERLIRYNVPDGQYGWTDGHKGGFVTKLEAISMLKSLRPYWKPSEEQMCNLKKAYESYDFCDGERKALESLYEQLKKL